MGIRQEDDLDFDDDDHDIDSGHGDHDDAAAGGAASDDGTAAPAPADGTATTGGETTIDGDGDDREAIRERRREERRQRREAQRRREERQRNELAAAHNRVRQLEERLGRLEQHGQANSLAAIDQQINQLASQYVNLKEQVARGTENQNGREVADATEKMIQIRQHAERLAAQKHTLIQRQQQAANVPPPPDPRLASYAAEWLSDNSWCTVGGTDPDSRRVAAIDQSLDRDGWDPNTPEYWAELTRRVRAELPHRAPQPPANQQRQQQRQPGGAPVGGSSRSAAVGGNGGNKPPGYTLSPERVAALKEAGMWDDPKKRAEMTAMYQNYDRENGAA